MEWSPGHFGKNLKQMSACSGVMINLALNRSNAKATSCQHSALLSMCWHWSNHLHACARVANTSPLLTPACSNVDDKGPCKDTNLATVSAMRALVASSAGSHCWQVWHMEAAAATGNQRASSGSTVVSTEAPEKRRWARHNSEIALCVANGPRPRRNTSAPLRFFRRGSIRGRPLQPKQLSKPKQLGITKGMWAAWVQIAAEVTTPRAISHGGRVRRGVARRRSDIIYVAFTYVVVVGVCSRGARQVKISRRCRGTEPAATRHNLDWQQREAETAFKPHQSSMPLPLGPKQPRGRDAFTSSPCAGDRKSDGTARNHWANMDCSTVMFSMTPRS